MGKEKTQPHPRFGKDVYVDVTAVVTGDVEIGDSSSVWPHAVLRGDVDRIVIGKYTNVQDLCVLHVGDAEPCRVGDSVTVGHQACLHGCTVGSDVLIGIGAIILSRAIVDNEVVIGAGSLVPEGKRLESGYVYFGRPVRRIRRITDKDLESNRYWVKKYHELALKHQAGAFGRIGLLVSGEDIP